VPQIQLSTYGAHLALPVRDSLGQPLALPRVQLRCWLRVPGLGGPRDGIIDTGSPYSWLPEPLWQHWRAGTDYEVLPFETGFPVPRGRTAGWSYSFRMARLLVPLDLFDTTTSLRRDRAIVQLVNGVPPTVASGSSPAVAVIGLWGGLLDGLNVRLRLDPITGAPGGALEW
jgi:hypothetical protein